MRKEPVENKPHINADTHTQMQMRRGKAHSEVVCASGG